MDSYSYHIISFEISNEDYDIVSGILYDENCLGVEENDGSDNSIILKAYFDDKEPLSIFQKKIGNLIPQAQKINGTTISLNDNKFKAHTFEPIELVSNLWIVPPDDMPIESKMPDGKKIIIRPGTAFGTGRHETTQLAAKQIIELENTSESFLDVGCGSGILALTAHMKGFKKIDGIEIDPLAVTNCEENLMLNKIDSVKIYDDIKNCPHTYDVVLANIITPTLIYLKHELLKKLKQNGILILSGITKDEVEDIKNAFGDLNFLKQDFKNEWQAFVFRK